MTVTVCSRSLSVASMTADPVSAPVTVEVAVQALSV